MENSQTASQTTPQINAATTLPSKVPIPIVPKPSPQPAQKKSLVRKILNFFQPKLKDLKPKEVKKEEDALNKIVVEESTKTIGTHDALGVNVKDALAQQPQTTTRV